MIQDIRYAARTLAHRKGFTVVMLLTVALSIGATSTIVSVSEGVLLRPLPYANPTGSSEFSLAIATGRNFR